jgi:hypothetical protein
MNWLEAKKRRENEKCHETADLCFANAYSLKVISHLDLQSSIKKNRTQSKKEHRDTLRMNNDTRVFIISLFHYKKINIFWR